MAASGVRVQGLSKVVRELKALGLDVQDLKDAFSKVAEVGKRNVERHTPRGLTGRLVASVRGNRAQSKAVVRAGRASARHAGPINYGWPKRNIRPALFMQRGDEDTRPEAVRLLEQDINRTIKRRGLR